MIFPFLGFVPNVQADPPVTDQVLWLKADSGVMADGSPASVGEVVDLWQDQSVNNNHAQLLLGDPQLATENFPNGNYPVIRFNGDDGFSLVNETATRLTDFSIFILSSYDAGSYNSRIFCNYSVGNLSTQYGYALGTTAGGDSDWWYSGSSELSTGAPYAADENYLTIYTLQNSNDKDLYVYHENDGLVGQASELDAAPIQYHNDPGLPVHNCTIGTIFIDWPGYGYYGNLNGDIAEILIYDTVNEQLRNEVGAYLELKYGINAIFGCEDLGSHWESDLNQDCYIDLDDLLIMVGNWLVCNDPEDPGCADTW